MPIANTSNNHIAHRSQEEGQGGTDRIPELTESQLRYSHIAHAQTLQTHNFTNLFGTSTATCEAK